MYDFYNEQISLITASGGFIQEFGTVTSVLSPIKLLQTFSAFTNRIYEYTDHPLTILHTRLEPPPSFQPPQYHEPPLTSAVIKVIASQLGACVRH